MWIEDLEHKIDAKWKKLNDDSRKYPTRNEKCFCAFIFEFVASSPQGPAPVLSGFAILYCRVTARTLDRKGSMGMMS